MEIVHCPHLIRIHRNMYIYYLQIQKIKISFSALALTFCMIFCCITSCTSDFEDEELNLETSSRLIIRLTDAPGDFEKVNIDLQEMHIKNSDGWNSLESFEAGIYNLLELQNGVEEVLVDEMSFNSDITEIRLILGEENTVVVDGKEFVLKTPSGQKSGVKIKIDGIINDGSDFSVLLDFDAHKSVIKAGNSGAYILKPVIKATMPDGTEVEGEEDEGEDEGNNDEDGNDDDNGDGNDEGDDDDEGENGDEGDDNDDDNGNEGDDDEGENDGEGEDDSKKLVICHIPPGNPDNSRTISISESAWPAHEAHGDSMGACGEGDDDDSDDGDGSDDGDDEDDNGENDDDGGDDGDDISGN